MTLEHPTPPLLQREKRLLWLLLLFGLVVRLGYVLVFVARGKQLTWGDELSYDELARNLNAYGVFGTGPHQPTVMRAPLYPFLMAGFYAVFGRSFPPLLAAQAIAAALSAPLLALIGRRLSGSLTVGMVAGVLFVLNPVLIFTTGLFYTETLYLLLLLGIVYLWLTLVPLTPRWPRTALISGALFGLSHLMRPNFLAFPVLLFLWLRVALGNLRQALSVTAVVVLAMLITMLPWTARNYVVTQGKIVPISANAGMQVHQGNNDIARDGGALDMSRLEPFPQMDETDRDKAYLRLGLTWIREHPVQFIARIPFKVFKFYAPLETSNRGTMIVRLAPFINALYVVYYLLAAVGLLLTARRWRVYLLPYFFILYLTALAAFLYGGTRYGQPIQPFFMLFAAEAIVALLAGRFGLPRRGFEHGRAVPAAVSSG